MTATAKGAARREAIVDAAVELVVTGGPDAVSHRAVARQAGVPLAATTYYFASLDDLLVTAVQRAAEAETAAAAELVASLPARPRSAGTTAAAVVDVLLGRHREDADLQAFYERFVAGGRHPVLRPVLQAARARIDELLADLLRRCGHPGADAGLLVAVVDGTVLSALVEGDGRARERARDAVAGVLSAG